MEIIKENEFANLKTEDEKRLFLKKEMAEHNYNLVITKRQITSNFQKKALTISIKLDIFNGFRNEPPL